MNKISVLIIALLISCASAAKIEDKKSTPEVTEKPAVTEPAIAGKDTVEKKYDETGLSSWYGEQFQNKPTASGELFDRFKLTAAHRSLPFGTEVKVHNLENQKETLVRINDRGPYNKTRIIDVSERAAEILEFKEIGVAKVGLTIINSKESESPVVAKKDIQLVRDEDNFSLEDDDEEEEEEEEDTLIPPKKEEPKKKGGTSNVEKETPPAKTPSKTPAVKETPKETVKETPKETTKEKTSKNESNDPQPKGYTVQIGVFKEKKRAENFKSQMKAAFNENVFLFVRSGTFVVQIGDFSNRNDAVILRDKVKEKGIFGFIPQK